MKKKGRGRGEEEKEKEGQMACVLTSNYVPILFNLPGHDRGGLQGPCISKRQITPHAIPSFLMRLLEYAMTKCL